MGSSGTEGEVIIVGIFDGAKIWPLSISGAGRGACLIGFGCCSCTCGAGGTVIGMILKSGGRASGRISGTSTNANRTEAFKMKVAIIQRRLRVWILPADSKVESSNMACLPGS
jgi:hypothetical protein